MLKGLTLCHMTSMADSNRMCAFVVIAMSGLEAFDGKTSEKVFLTS